MIVCILRKFDEIGGLVVVVDQRAEQIAGSINSDRHYSMGST